MTVETTDQDRADALLAVLRRIAIALEKIARIHNSTDQDAAA